MALAAMVFAMPADAQQQRTAPDVTTPAIGAATLKNGQNKQVGNVAFVETPNGMLIQVRVDSGSGIGRGMHGFHIHENGTCETPDFQSAGGHFNPAGKEHGILTPGGPHAGDLPNIWVDGDGAAQADIIASGLEFGGGANSLDKPAGTSVLIHATPDDYATNPSGKSGDRIACGVITKNVQR
jgi:Cu-Zn family superoxide dismutase